MSDTALNKIIQYGTTAQRVAFTPNPAVGSQVLYIWFDTDNSPDTYIWDGSGWIQINPTSSSGDVVGPAIAVDDHIAIFDGTTGKLIADGGGTISDVIAAAIAGSTPGITELTGDVTAGPGSGSQVATIAANAVGNTEIANDSVSFSKIQNITTDTLLGRDTAGTGDVEEIAVSSGVEFTSGPGLRVTERVRTHTIGITIDGGGSVITPGTKGYRSFMASGTIVRWRIMADVAGDIEFDIFKDAYAGWIPSTSIVGSSPPEMTATTLNEDTTLSGWSTGINAGDIFKFDVVSVTNITRVTLELTIVVI